MKIQYLIVYLIFQVTLLKAQEPQPPNLCYVTVGDDSLVHLFWNYPDTTTINGYIIKRIIFNGTDVINGTLNNIAVLQNNTNTTFSDTTFEYQTTANPYQHPETYTLNAFVLRNDSTVLSNMALQQKTIFLSAKWDLCLQKATITWTPYIQRNVLKYNLLYSTDLTNFTLLNEFQPTDTSFTTSNLDKNTHYYFKIQAILVDGNACKSDTSQSNYANFITISTVKPDKLTNVNISTIDNNLIETNFYSSDNEQIKNFTLYRNNSIITTFPANKNYLSYTDTTDATIINQYSIHVIDACDNDVLSTNVYNNLVLNVTDANKTYILSWNNILLFDNIPDNYTIQVYKSTEWGSVQVVNGSTTIFSIKYEDLYLPNTYNTDLQNIKFRIIANYDTISSYSNIITIPIVGVFAIPNAFNPLSNNQINSQFTIQAEFINNFSISIYTESGNIIFKSDDIKNCWTGKFPNGQLVPRNAYIYNISYTDNSGNNQKVNGVVNVVY